jgi:voltage-gated potassium channel
MSTAPDATISDRSAFDRWERSTEWPLTVTALLFLIAYAWPILDQGLSTGWRDICRIVNVAAWILFAVDYVVRLSLTSNRRRYFVRHLPDLAVIALPLLRPLRLLRVVMLLRVLNRGATNELRGRIIAYVTGATVLLLFVSSLAVLDAERGHPGANIANFGDALWWSAATITTVGYGDRFPTTVEGRFVAAGLMIGGIALLGIVTATLASWLIDRVRETEQDAQAATRADYQRLAGQLRTVESDLVELKALLTAVIADSGRNRQGVGSSDGINHDASASEDSAVVMTEATAIGSSTSTSTERQPPISRT